MYLIYSLFLLTCQQRYNFNYAIILTLIKNEGIMINDFIRIFKFLRTHQRFAQEKLTNPAIGQGPMLDALRLDFDVKSINKRNKPSNFMAKLILFLCLLAALANGQSSPLWQATPYIQAVTFTVVNNNQKTTSPFTLTVTFTSIFTSPRLALGNDDCYTAIPSIRFTPGNVLAFHIYETALSATGFTHNLILPNANTSLAFLTCRYIVFNSAVLSKQFQVYSVIDQAGTNINTTPNGSSRSDNIPVALSAAATVANNPVCLPFLSGVTASSNDHYQLNLTCAILAASPSQATATATVYASTSVSLLSFYLIVWDPVVLAVQSFFFADSGITSTYYNVQNSFLSLPNGFMDKNYIGGLTSFSAFSNQQLNFTLSSLLVSTTSTSLYDSSAQLQIRTRNCSKTSAPLYNKADGLCYSLCPSYTYVVSAAFLCQACSANCISCLNSSVCTTCLTGMTVSNGLCICTNSSYLYNGTCYGCHYSCLTCTTTGQYNNCLTCDPTSNRVSTPASGTCPCTTGYIDSYAAVCSEICGDGVARTDACDDGNTVSGDGCSSTCTIEQNFTCEKNIAFMSSCYYIGNVTISEFKTFKLDYQNTMIIYLQVSPWIGSMCQLANSVSLTSNFSSSSSFDYDCKHNMLVYMVGYVQSPEGLNYTVFLNPTTSGIFSRLPATNVTWLQFASDNGYRLHYYTQFQYSVAISFQYISKIFGFLIMASGFLYIFGRLKWIGNLLFFSLQFQYLSMIVIPNFNPMLSGLSQIKTVLGYNQALGIQDFDLPKYPSFSILNFSKQYLLNVNVMVSLQVLAIIMYFIYYITYRRNELMCKKYGGDPQKTYKSLKYGKFFIFFDWQFFMFWTFFNMTAQITAMVLFTELVDYSALPLILFNAICIVLAVFPLFARRKQVKSYTELLYYEERGRQQSIFSLCCYMLMYAFLALSLSTAKIMYYLIFLFPAMMIIYVICRKPFQSKWMRAAYFVNCFCITISLIYNQLIITFENDVYYLPFGSLATILLDWIFNLVVWGREAYVICKYGGQKDLNELLHSHTKTTSNNDNEGQMFFKESSGLAKGNKSFLSSLIKSQNHPSATKRTQLSRVKKLGDDAPEGLKEEHQAKLDEQEELERIQLKKKRERWLKEARDVPETRERTRKELQSNALSKSATKPKIRSTAQKGIEMSVIEAVNNNISGKIE